MIGCCTDLTAKGPDADDGGHHFITGGDGVEGAIILNFLDEEEKGQSSYYNTLYRLTEFKTLPGYRAGQNAPVLCMGRGR